MSSRIQLALNVTDVESATKFYSQMFGTEPNKVRPGYANFAIADPPLKLVLLENPHPDGALNHLGVEMADSQAVEAITDAFLERGLETRVSTQEACCHSIQDKVYVTAPEVPIGMWEFYTVVDDSPEDATNADGVCCAAPEGDEQPESACCV
ncbi:MAG: ArsI/CadI family heavy metal resistance metalloenzyme [Acidimicrobiales bacterium]